MTQTCKYPDVVTTELCATQALSLRNMAAGTRDDVVKAMLRDISDAWERISARLRELE